MDFSSKSVALNIFVSESLKFNTKYNIPFKPISFVILLSSSSIYSSVELSPVNEGAKYWIS